MLKRQLSETQMFELRDHRDNTLDILVKCYTPAQLSFMDWIDERTVKNSEKYLPVRVDNWPSLLRFKDWKQRRPYRVLYIRLDEVKKLFNRRTRKTLEVWCN